MIIQPFSGVVHRMLTPEWAYAPLSGAGAARQGGRANRQGIDALYTSFDDVTATREYKQQSPLMPPGTLIAITVTLSSVVEFRDGYAPGAWDPLWQDFFCDWREMRFNQKIEPPSWALGDLALSQAKGIVFPSMANPGGVNLVIYTSNLDDQYKLDVYRRDMLPKNKKSWE